MSHTPCDLGKKAIYIRFGLSTIWARWKVARIQGLSLDLTARAAERVQHHGQLLRSCFSGLSCCCYYLPNTLRHLDTFLAPPITWQTSVFLPSGEIVKGLMPFCIPVTVCGGYVKGCKYSGVADLMPFQSPKLPLSFEKLLRPRLRQGLDRPEGDVERVGKVFGKRNRSHFPFGGQGK